MINLSIPNSTLIRGKKSYIKINNLTNIIEDREHSKFEFKKKNKLFHFEQNINFLFKKKDKEMIYNNILKKKYKIISFQLASCYQNPKLDNGKFFPKGKKINEQLMLKNIGKNIKWLRKLINKNTKIAVENNNYFKTGAYEIVTNPDFINMICKKFKVFILFDYSHAQISSYNKNMHFEEYVNKFLKSKIVQVHFCGFSFSDNQIIDSHTKPKKNDYINLLNLVKTFSNLKYITVEYYKNIKTLENILLEIKKISKKII